MDTQLNNFAVRLTQLEALQASLDERINNYDQRIDEAIFTVEHLVVGITKQIAGYEARLKLLEQTGVPYGKTF